MKTTKEQYAEFKLYVSEWQQLLGLVDWHIYVFHKKIDDSFANCATSVSGAAATITLNTTWDNREITSRELRECALHEVMHVVTAPLLSQATARFADEYDLEAAEHGLVTRMTNVISKLAGEKL